MDRAFFISDIHLGAGNKSVEAEKYRKLTSFLNHINTPGTQLFIVGDLFDFWFEYKTVVPKQYFPLLFHISKLIENNVIVHFSPGNHDCWIDDFFSHQIGMIVHPEEYAIELQSKQVYFFHGDGVSKKDTAYRILKKILRNPLNIFLYRLMHPDFGIPFAKLMATGSRKHTAGKDFGDEEDYVNFAVEKFNQGFNYVIVGHSHKPLLTTIGANRYINLGDWIQHFSYGKLENGILTLNFWNG